MRASPAFQVSLKHFGVWRGAVVALALLTVVVVMAWAGTSHPAQAHQPWGWAIAAVAVAAVLALSASLCMIRPFSLHWDGRRWHLRRAPRSVLQSELQAGDLTVALDIGPWLLLRFVAVSGRGRAATHWLPVQRGGIEEQWHALRCAVYAPRADSSAAAPDS